MPLALNWLILILKLTETTWIKWPTELHDDPENRSKHNSVVIWGLDEKAEGEALFRKKNWSSTLRTMHIL